MKIIVNYFIGNLPALNFLIVDKTPGGGGVLPYMGNTMCGPKG